LRFDFLDVDRFGFAGSRTYLHIVANPRVDVRSRIRRQIISDVEKDFVAGVAADKTESPFLKYLKIFP
jgi:hypothetical protein